MTKNNIVLGGRLSKVLTEDLQLLVPEQQFLSIQDCDLVNRLIQYKGSTWFKSIDQFILFDTALSSLTDWTATDDMLSYLGDKQFLIATRFAKFTPARYKKMKNVTLYEPDNDELNVDYISSLIK